MNSADMLAIMNAKDTIRANFDRFVESMVNTYPTEFMDMLRKLSDFKVTLDGINRYISVDNMSRLKKLWLADDKVEAIKLFRNLTHSTLYDAKHFMETFAWDNW